MDRSELLTIRRRAVVRRKTQEEIAKLREEGVVLHNHHVVPRHAGGTDEPGNLVLLTVEEHAEAHKALYEKHGRTEDKLAWLGLAGMIGQEELFLERSRLGGYKSNIGDIMRGKEFSEDHRRKLAEKANNRAKIRCPLCGVSATKQMLVRHHGEGKCNVEPDLSAPRTCKDCGETKSLADFAQRGRKQNGHRTYKNSCKACENKRRQARRARKRN